MGSIGQRCIKNYKEKVRALLKKHRIGNRFSDDGFNYKVNEEALIADTTAKSKGSQELIEKRHKRIRSHIESIAK
jgi:hypothetical protein